MHCPLFDSPKSSCILMEMMIKRIFLLVASIVLTGCAALSSTPTPTATLPPTAETPNTLPDPTDPTQLITVQAGKPFDIVLPSNSSTGYRWKLVEDLDANLIELVGQDYLAQQPVLAGSGGVDVWTFRAVNTGETKITLGYYPPNSNAQPDETVIFSIRVE